MANARRTRVHACSGLPKPAKLEVEHGNVMTRNKNTIGHGRELTMFSTSQHLQNNGCSCLQFTAVGARARAAFARLSPQSASPLTIDELIKPASR